MPYAAERKDTMAGPKAPKDPEKKRKSFFIMRNKEVAGSPQPDGKGVQTIFLDDSRMISFARITGGITDEEILGLLPNAEGFRRLVYSIGVTVETDNPTETAEFVMQMYGKRDPYRSGTVFQVPVRADGMEKVIKLNEVEWSDDDRVPGQMRFVFEKAGTLAKVSVRLYLQDGYDVPEPEEECQIDLESSEYKQMLEKSVMQTGNTLRLKRAIERAKKGEDVTVAFIGGSITQGAGAIPINTQCYAYKTFQGFCQLAGKGTEENIHYVKAGVGGTSSEFGMVRYQRDVCSEGAVKPDLVVVEFAVNDAGDETGGESYDSLVNKIWYSENQPAVILLFSVFTDDWNLQDKLGKVGEVYQLPMVSVKDCVVEQFYKKPGQGRVFSKAQFFYDVYHPSNLGHTVMADCLVQLFRTVDGLPGDETEPDLRQIEAPFGREFAGIQLLDRTNVPEGVKIDCGDFSGTDKELQGAERNLDLKITPLLPDNWMHESGSRPFVIDIECSALLIVEKDSADPKFGIAEITVDGEKVRSIDPHEVGWNHCNALICFRGKEKKEHHVEISMQAGDEDKQFTILGFGYVN